MDLSSNNPHDIVAVGSRSKERAVLRNDDTLRSCGPLVVLEVVAPHVVEKGVTILTSPDAVIDTTDERHMAHASGRLHSRVNALNPNIENEIKHPHVVHVGALMSYRVA